MPHSHPSSSGRPPSLYPEPSAGNEIMGHVLVVDDDASSRTLLADWLSAYGHRVTTAADGPSALLAVEREIPDAVVLDVMIPGMDGFTVCEHLHNNPRTAMIPVLLLTALNEREDRLRGMRAGANDFLPKPADLPYVLLRVRNAVHVKQLHDELTAKFREICRQEQLKENLLHMIVHDLRTPLAGLEGFLQLLQMSTGSKLEERPTHYLRQALHATHNLSQQIDLLLDIHRMEEGRMPVNLVEHSLMEDVDRALEPLKPLFGARRLVLDKPPEIFSVVGDPGLLQRVVSNLVGNAIRFTSPHRGEIAVRVHSDTACVRVEVADNGPGIDPAHHEAIFEKFFQVSEHINDRSSGLGLAFCKLAVEAQRGRIGVISQPGGGSRFWFEVPSAA